jgi:hypothetical protein
MAKLKKFKYQKEMILKPFPTYFCLATTPYSNSKCFMEKRHSISYRTITFYG